MIAECVLLLLPEDEIMAATSAQSRPEVPGPGDGTSGRSMAVMGVTLSETTRNYVIPKER